MVEVTPSTAGVMLTLYSAESAPANAANTPATTKEISLNQKVLYPIMVARFSLSRVAIITRPVGDSTNRLAARNTTTKKIRAR